MRKALITFLMAATAATPLIAQDNETRGDRQERHQQRQESEQQNSDRQSGGQQGGGRQAQQQQAQQQQAQQQQARQQQFQAQQQIQRQQFQQQQVQVEQQQARQQQFRQQEQGRGFDRSGNRGGWQGRNDGSDGANRQALQQQIEASREASRRSAEQTIGGNYARQAQRNEANYERQLIRQYGGDRNGQDRNRQDRNRGDRGNWQNDRGNRGGAWQGDRNQGGDGWNRGWRNDNRYDWQRYRYSNRRIFNPGPYYSPYRGYGYNRLGIGLVLDSLFYSNRYWIDPYEYHLPPAPDGTEWVRYYNDVVLVDVYSGQVVDVIYDFFW